MATFEYKLLVVDNDNHGKPYKLKSGKLLPITLFRTIDEALIDLGLPVNEYLNKQITKFDGVLTHGYDIVLLDYQMDENQKSVTGVYEYPLGAVSLQPLYLKGFDTNNKRGSCIIQPFSKVMWTECPKAAALTYLIQNQFSHYKMELIHDGTAEQVDIDGLIRMRAESIISDLPFYALNDFRDLLDMQDDQIMRCELATVGNLLNASGLTLADLRPDVTDVNEVKEWIIFLLRGRGYTYEAVRCWQNQCVNLVTHDLPLVHRDYSPLNPLSWVKEDKIHIDNPSGDYYVCMELLNDIVNLKPSVIGSNLSRSVHLHKLFRVDLKENPTGQSGYPVEDAFIGTNFKPKLLGKANNPGRYIYIHVDCLNKLLNGMIMLLAQRSIDENVYIYSNNRSNLVYFIFSQKHNDGVFSREDVTGIRNRLADATSLGGLGGLLESWGWLEVWGTKPEAPGFPLSYFVSKYIFKGIDQTNSVFFDPDIVAINEGDSKIALVIPCVNKR